MRNVFLIFFLSVILCTTASALEFDKDSYVKGETIWITGKCIPGEENRINAAFRNSIIFDQNTECVQGNFSFSYKTKVVDPSGSWNVIARPQNDSGKTEVLLSASSAYYKITFLSPSNGELKRGQSVPISVMVDDEGTAVNDANVYVFDFEGKRTLMENRGNGIYSFSSQMPFDGPLGEWDIIVVAEKEKNITLGGERKLLIQIIGAPIVIDIENPQEGWHMQNNRIQIRGEVSYENGTLIPPDKIKSMEIYANEEKISDNSGKNTFTASYDAKSEGTHTLRFVVEDEAGNNAEKSIDVYVTCPLQCTFEKNFPIAILGLAFVALVVFVAHKTVLSGRKLANAKSEKERMHRGMERLQKDYFNKKIGSQEYKEAMAEYREKLLYAEQIIKEIGKKEGK